MLSSFSLNSNVQNIPDADGDGNERSDVNGQCNGDVNHDDQSDDDEDSLSDYENNKENENDSYSDEDVNCKSLHFLFMFLSVVFLFRAGMILFSLTSAENQKNCY